MHEQMAWSAPGQVAEELIGFGVTGEVWRGRSTRTGAFVVLKRLYVAPGADDLALLRRQASLSAGPGRAHLLPIHEIVADGSTTVLVLAYAAGGSLATLLRRCGRLRPGEVVTALAPIAVALAGLHGAGISHGSVRPTNVLFTVDGRPLLAEPGLRSVANGRSSPDGRDPAPVAGTSPAPSDDVFRLAELAVLALIGEPRADPVGQLAGLGAAAPPALLRVLRRALSPSPRDRGSAADLAVDLLHSCAPEPLPLTDASDRPVAVLRGFSRAAPMSGPRPVAAARQRAATIQAARPVPPGPRHRRPEPARRVSRPARWLAGVGAVAVAGAGAAWAADGPVERSAGAVPAVPAALAVPGGLGARPETAGEWLAVLDGLDAVRARAYERADVALLRQVYAPGAHLTVDAGQLARISAAGDSVRGVRHRLRVITIADRGATRARLRIVQSLPDSVRLHRGRPAGAIPGSTERTLIVDLVQTPAGWRLA